MICTRKGGIHRFGFILDWHVQASNIDWDGEKGSEWNLWSGETFNYCSMPNYSNAIFVGGVAAGCQNAVKFVEGGNVVGVQFFWKPQCRLSETCICATAGTYMSTSMWVHVQVRVYAQDTMDSAHATGKMLVSWSSFNTCWMYAAFSAKCRAWGASRSLDVRHLPIQASVHLYRSERRRKTNLKSIAILQSVKFYIYLYWEYHNPVPN